MTTSGRKGNNVEFSLSVREIMLQSGSRARGRVGGDRQDPGGLYRRVEGLGYLLWGRDVYWGRLEEGAGTKGFGGCFV